MEGQTLTEAIVAKATDLSKCRRQFLSHILMLFLSVRHRVNFSQLSRHSEQYCDRTIRLHFERHVDFAAINPELIHQHGSGHFLLALDPTYLPKSGKKTPGLSRYCGAARRSGSAQKALWGLEVSLLSVIDVEHRTAWHRRAAPLDAVQTPDHDERQSKDISLIDHYAQVVLWQAQQCQQLSGYLAVDAYFAKASFIDRICDSTELHLVSRLRQDARLRYLYTGPKASGRGRPRQYGGRIDFSRLDFEYFALSYQDSELRIYSAVVNCPFLKRNVRVAYTQYLNAASLPTHYKLYFSTDLNLPAWLIVKYYRLRYQQEFLIRDAKQFTGLTDCQARSINKVGYHLNTALTAVNVAKVEQGVKAEEPFSMADVKTLYHNRLLLDRFISILPKGVEVDKNHPEIQELYQLGCKPA